MSLKLQSLLLGVITILLWSSLATFGNLLRHLPPFYLLGLAFVIGGLPALIKPKELFPSLRVTLVGITGYFGYHFFLFYSFRYAPAVEANLINYLWPVLLVLLTPLFFREEKLRTCHFVGAIFSVIGCVLLVFGKGGSFKSEYLAGYFLATLAAFTWPVYSLTRKRLPATSVYSIGGFCLGAGALCLLTHFLIEPRVMLEGGDAWKILLMGLGPFGLAFYTWDLALQKGNAQVVGSLAYLTPVLSTMSLVLFGGELLSFSSLWAMLLITGGASSSLLDFLPLKVLKKG